MGHAMTKPDEAASAEKRAANDRNAGDPAHRPHLHAVPRRPVEASPNGFDPAIDGRAFRDALGCFATGVTVVTVDTPDGPVGITANSFASVSLDPPLVLWSIDRASSRYDVFASAEHSAIHVLGEGQRDLAMAFVREARAFKPGWRTGVAGVPLLEGTLARFECQHHATHDGGDHAILVSRVIHAERGVGTPLVFSQGKFGSVDGSR